MLSNFLELFRVIYIFGFFLSYISFVNDGIKFGIELKGKEVYYFFLDNIFFSKKD